MTVSGIANISESMRRKCAGEWCPESFLAETQTHVGLEGSERRRLARYAENTALHLELLSCGHVLPTQPPTALWKDLFFNFPWMEKSAVIWEASVLCVQDDYILKLTGVGILTTGLFYKGRVTSVTDLRFNNLRWIHYNSIHLEIQCHFSWPRKWSVITEST